MAIELDHGSFMSHDRDCISIPSPLRDEPIITKKIYDSCRRQDCLELTARAAQPVCIDGKNIKEGDVIPVPHGAGTVTIDNLTIKKIRVADKKPSPFKKGFWDIEVRFVFEYLLAFYDCQKCLIAHIGAISVQNKKFTLYGSDSPDSVMATDLFGSEAMTNNGPFIWVDAKAVALKAEFRCNHRDRTPVDVSVTIGLFCVLHLFRLVCLNIQSRGYCVPRECDYNPTDPCEYFHGLDFPTDIFTPPPRAEFFEK